MILLLHGKAEFLAVEPHQAGGIVGEEPDVVAAARTREGHQNSALKRKRFRP